MQKKEKFARLLEAYILSTMFREIECNARYEALKTNPGNWLSRGQKIDVIRAVAFNRRLVIAAVELKCTSQQTSVLVLASGVGDSCEAATGLKGYICSNIFYPSRNLRSASDLHIFD